MVAHFLHKTPVEIETTMTWPDLQAQIEHWKYEPPLAWLAARYFEVDERPIESGDLDTEEAETIFRSMFASMAQSGKVFGQ